MEQFPSPSWKEAAPSEGAEELIENPEPIHDPFNETTFFEVPEEIKDAMEALQKKAQTTELPEIRIEQE